MPGKAEDIKQRPIVLVGFMAAGKSTIGPLLAKRLDLPFVDSDRIIEQTYGFPIAQMFKVHGEPEFREAERATILHLLGLEPQVIAIGGGAFMNAEVRAALTRQARTIWLDAPFELLMVRLAGSNNRPLVADQPEPKLRLLWEERVRDYSLAHIRIDTSGLNADLVVERIVEALGAQS